MATTLFKPIWQQFLREIGSHQVALVSDAAVGLDPKRWLLSVYLRHDGGSKRFLGHFVQVNTGNTEGVRRVMHEEPSRGGIVVDQPFAEIVETLSEFEVSWPLPVNTTQGIPGAVQILAEASHEVWYPDLIDIVPVQDQYEYSLSAQQDWLDSEARVTGFYDPPLQSGYPQQRADWRYGGLTFQAGVPTLQLKRAYLGTGTSLRPAQLEVIRPAYSLISGAESTTGPSQYNDTIGGDPAELVKVAKLKAYRYLATAQHLTPDERTMYASLVGPQESIVRREVRHWLPRDEMPKTQEAA